MKNSLNLVFVVFVLIVLGCSCPNKLKELNLGNNSATPNSNPTPLTANSANTANTAQPNKNNSLSMSQYNLIKNGMTYSEATKILNSPGVEVSSSEIGKYKTATYKWDGENYSFIILTFQNDNLLSKTQANLK